MIPINQLRVGSYWQLNTKTGQVFKIVTPCEIADAAEYGIGIELTPEVLEKCGFKQHYDGEFYNQGEYEAIVVIIEEDGTIYVKSNRDEVWRTINSLHQLQNLYLSLTGTELTYTP